jgi:hypothetical protein
MAAVLPFASTTVIKASSSSQAEIYYGLAKAVDVSAAAAAETHPTQNSPMGPADVCAGVMASAGAACLTSSAATPRFMCWCVWLCQTSGLVDHAPCT